MRARSACLAAATPLILALGSDAWAQYPPQQPYPPQAYPQPYPPATAAPPPQLPYPPAQPAPPVYPPQPAPVAPPPITYPPAQTGYPPAGAYPYAPYPPPQGAYPAQMIPPPRPPRARYRSPGEMGYLFGAGLVYGVGSGVWIDAVAHVTDPGISVIAPLVLGAGVPIGLYVWDGNDEFDRGVPSSIATGILLGGLEGMAISGLQWQLTGNGGPSSWDFPVWTTVTFLTATGGGLGGYAFGEWFQPDPRSLAFIASGAGWGAINGIFLGAGSVNGDWKNGAAVGGFIGYNAGILATGLLSTAYVPSWQTIRYLWLGEVLGALITTPVYLFYIGSSSDPRHGLIANAVGGMAGIAIAAALTANMHDSGPGLSWLPDNVHFSLGPTQYGGAQLMAFGQF